MSVQELARLVQCNAAITLATAHASGIADTATASDNIADAANNRAARRSSYNDPQTGDTGLGGTVALDEEMLQGMLDLADQFTFNVSEIAGGVHGQNSRHYAGVAFDVNILNGRVVNGLNPDFRGLMQSAREAGATEVLGPGDSGHSTHVHVAWPRNVETDSGTGDQSSLCEAGSRSKKPRSALLVNQFYLRIERLAQNRYSGDPEIPVALNQIDPEKNLIVYLTGNISLSRSVQLRVIRVATLALDGNEQSAHGPAAESAEVYRATLPHYTLANRSKYILRAIDDDASPYAIASVEIQTI